MSDCKPYLIVTATDSLMIVGPFNSKEGAVAFGKKFITELETQWHLSMLNEFRVEDSGFWLVPNRYQNEVAPEPETNVIQAKFGKQK